MVVVICGGYAVYLLARMAGIPVLAWLTGRRWGRRGGLLGAFGTGVAGTTLLSHPSYSQNFFISSSYGFGAVLSAMGFATLVQRYRLHARVVVGIVGLVMLTAAALVATMAVWPRPAHALSRLRLPGSRR